MKHHLLFLSIVFNCTVYLHGAFTLTPEIAQKIGEQIWRNEGAGKRDNLIIWKLGEDFPSLGIGHFIWHPKGSSSGFSATFADLISFAQRKGVAIPQWVLQSIKQGGAPWKNREDFLADTQSARMEELRSFLDSTKDLQIRFMIKRLDNALKSIIKATPESQKSHVKKMITYLKNSYQGMYVLIDYLNFKGEGTNPKERYNNQGWGLLDVLLAMPTGTKPQTAISAFAQAAGQMLEQRVANAPKERHEEQWLTGWKNRIKTYTNLSLNEQKSYK